MTRLREEDAFERSRCIVRALDILYLMQLFAQAAELYLEVFRGLPSSDYRREIPTQTRSSGTCCIVATSASASAPTEHVAVCSPNLRKLLHARRSHRLHAIAPTHASVSSGARIITI